MPDRRDTRPTRDVATPDELRSFGRRRARRLSPRQQELLETVLPRVAVVRRDGSIEVADADGDRPQWLEIGFGGGEHLIWQARANPDVHIVGCEPFIDGVVKVLTAIEEQALGNISVHDDDVRPLLRACPDARFERVFVLFPDPWPKRRHLKRRLINDALLDALARTMTPGAELRIATDIDDYARTILLNVSGHPMFEWQARRAADWRERPADWPQTRYEQKAGLAGRRAYYFRFRRRSP